MCWKKSQSNDGPENPVQDLGKDFGDSMTVARIEPFQFYILNTSQEWVARYDFHLTARGTEIVGQFSRKDVPINDLR